MGEVAIYSALYGGYDTIKPIHVDVPAYMFTDQPDLHAPGWTVIHRPHRIVTRNGPADLVAPMLAHKWWKTHPHEAINATRQPCAACRDIGYACENHPDQLWAPKCCAVGPNVDQCEHGSCQCGAGMPCPACCSPIPEDGTHRTTDAYVPDWKRTTPITIWIDASITPEPGFVDKALAALGDDDWAMVPHPWRTCIYTEADYSATLPRYAALAGRIRAQADFYRNVVGHPPNAGLIATGVNARRHTPAVQMLGQQWWDDILHWTHQDQISLPVLLRLAGRWSDVPRWNTNIGWTEGWALWPHLK